MKQIFVCFKMVTDYEQILPGDWDMYVPDKDGFEYVRQIINCFDESALELALRIKEDYTKSGQETCLTALTVTEDSDSSFFKTLSAAGFDRVIRIAPSFKGSFSPMALADDILAFLRQEPEPYDALLFGQQAAPFNNGQIPYFIAQSLGIPAVSNVISLKAEEHSLTAVSQKTDRMLTYSLRTPALYLIGNCKGTYLRMPTLRERMSVSKKEFPCYQFPASEHPDHFPRQLLRNKSERRPALCKNLTPKEAAQKILEVIEKEDLCGQKQH
ncbi:MAG: hypothetical protein HFH48_09475 [Lachnospiraceae bacterium]|nr:hypothetical protein [Lachnospiraceae bacterium]